MSIDVIGTQIDQTERAPVVLGSEKIPTGGRGLYHVTVDQVRDYILTYFGKDAIRLGEVDNTSDEDKPLSRATREALSKKLNKSDQFVRSINGLTGDIDLVPTVLGLGNVDNTSDKDKPLSEMAIRALATKLDKVTFKDFKRAFHIFEQQVYDKFTKLDEIDTQLLNRVSQLEKTDIEIQKTLQDLTTHLNKELARVSSTLSAEQQHQVLELISDNFEAFLQGSGYLTSALNNLHTVVLEEISLITDKITALGIKDSKINEEIQALTLNINKKFSSIDEEILDLNFTLDSQANAFARQFIEAREYLEALINKLKPLIDQASQKYLEDLLALQQTISKDSDEIRDYLTGLHNSLENQSDEMIALNFALNSKHDDLLDLMKSEDKTLAELIESASETAKQDMLDLGYQMQELSDGFVRKYDEVYGIIETQVESTKLIMNDKIVETKELIDQTKEDVEQTKVALEELRSDALETAEFYETKLSEISDYLENKSEALLSQLAQEVIDRNNAINAKAEDVLSKVNDRLNNLDLVVIQELDDKINALNDKLVQDVVNLSAEFTDYVNSQITSNNNTIDLKVQNVVDNLAKETADRLEKIKLLEDGLTQETMLRQEQDSTILSAFENYKLSTENSLANYREEINVKIGDALAESESIIALDSRVNALDEKTGDLTTSVSNVTEKLNTTATDLEATASQLSALSTEYQSNDTIVKGLILEESQNRSTALGNVTSKLDSLSSSFDSLNAPGRNILKDSNVELVRTGSEYLIGTYKVGELIVPGAQYTLIACITHEIPESDLTYAEIKWGQDSVTTLSFGVTQGSSKRIIKTTFTAKVNGFSGINFYYYPSTATSGLGIIHWAVLVKGESLPLTDWIESPYDRETRDTATTASINNLNTVITTKTDALAEQIKIVNAGVEAQGLSINSTIQEVNKTIADLDSTTGSKFEAINSKFTTERSTTDALIASESKARSDALAATTEYIDSFKSSFSGTGVNLLSSIYSDPDSLRKVSLANVSATVTPPDLDNNLPGSWTVSRTTTGSAYIAFSPSLSNYTSLELKSNSDYIVSGYFESVPANVTARFALKTNLGVIVNGTTFTINALGRFSSVIRLPSTVGISSGFLLLYVDVAGSVTNAKINVNRLMVERRIGTSSDPSEWAPGSANTIANVIQQIKTTATATTSVVERLDALVTKVADNDTSVRGMVAEEIKNVTDLNSNTLSKVETLSSSFSNQVVGSENLWWLAESFSDHGERTVESLTTDQQHQKLTITATASGLFSNFWKPLLRTENVEIDTTATYAISFEVKAAYPFIRVYSYIFGQDDPIVNKLVKVTPDKWTTIKLDNLVSVSTNVSETYSGLLGIRYLVSDNPSITEEDMIGKTLEIRDVQLQKGTTTSAYTKPSWVQRDEQKAIVDAAVTSETKARTTAEEAFTARIDGLVTTIESNDSTVKGLIATESQNRSTALTNVTTKLDTLSSSFESFTIGGANLLPYSNVFRDRTTMSLQDATNLQVAVENGVLRLNFTPTVSTSSWFTNWWPTDVNIDQALSEIKNSGVHAILSIWVKAVDVTKLPSTLPLIHLCSEYSYRPFTGVIGDISKGGWVQYYQLYDFSTRDPGTIHPYLQLSANSLGGGLLFSKWKFEIGDKPTDWSEYKEASKLLAEKTDATIVRVDKAITDANTANANAFTAVNAVLTDMPNAGINLLKGSVTNPTALTSFFNVTPAAVTPELYTTAFNSKLKGIKFTTKSTVTTNVFVYDTTQTASFTNLLPGSYVLSFWASSTTAGHSIKVGLQSTASVIVESSSSVSLTTKLTRYQVVLTITTAGKYAVRLTPNVSGVSGRVFSIERLMLEQQYGNNIVPSAWVEGLETSPYSLTPVNMSQALISQELDTNVSKTNATATLVDTLTTTVTNNDTFARSKLVEVTDSITNLSSTSNSKMETMASEFRKTLVTSSNNLWVFKNYRSYNGAEILPNNEEYSYNFQIGSSTYSGITGDLPKPEMKEGGLYTFSYSLEIISGTLTSIGYATAGTSSWSTVEAYFNDELITLDANLTYTLPVPLTSGVHHVVFVVKCLKVGTGSFHIQPNRSNTTAITTKVFQVALTKGTMKLPWELSLEDQNEQLANTKAYINTVQKTLADVDSALTEKFETLNTQVSSDRGTTSGEIARLDKNYSDLNSNTTQAFEGISSKFSAMPNGGVNLLPIEVSNPPSLPKPAYTSGHSLAVEGSTDTAGINRWKLTTGNANVGSGCYFNPGGGQTNLHLRLPVGKFIFSCYMKTESENSHQVAWVLYNTEAASTNFTLSSTLTRFSFVINNSVERNVCFLLMGNKSGIPGNTSFYVERMMLEVQNGDNQSPSVWATGTSDITRQLAVTAESVTTAYTDANKAIGTRIDTLKSSFEGQSIGGDNLWSLLDVATIRSAQGTTTKTDVNKDQEHCKVVINSFASNGCMLSFDDLLVDTASMLLSGEDYTLTFELKSNKALPVTISTFVGALNTFTATANTATGWTKYSFNFKSNGTSTTGVNQSFAILCLSTSGWVVNDWYEIKSVQLQKGNKATGFQKATKVLTNRIVKTAADISNHKETYASDKVANATAMDKMSAIFKSSAGSLTSDYILAIGTEWAHNYTDTDISTGFVKISDGKVGDTAYVKIGGADIANKYNIIHNKTPLVATGVYVVSYWAKREIGSTGTTYISVGLKNASGFIRYGRLTTITDKTPADGQWHFVSENIDVNGLADPTCYLGFGINHGDETKKAWIQGFKVTRLLTAEDTDSSVASTATLTTVQNTLSDATKAVADRTSLLETGLSKTNEAVATKADSKILDSYYTSSKTDEVIAGKITSYNTSLVIGGNNLISEMKLISGYINTEGGVSTATYDVHDPNYYEIKPGETLAGTYYSLNGVDGIGSTGRIAFYNKDKGFLSAHIWITSTSLNDPKYIVAPANSAFFRFSTLAKGIKHKLERGTKATDWSASIDDVQATLNVQAGLISDNNTKIIDQGKVLSTQGTSLTSIDLRLNNIGGTNLLQISSTEVGNIQNGVDISSDAFWRTSKTNPIAILPSMSYTFSAKIDCAMSVQWYSEANVFISQVWSTDVTATTSTTLKSPANAGYMRVAFRNSTTTKFNLSDAKFKIEEGLVATRWSPCPQDLVTNGDNVVIGGDNAVTHSVTSGTNKTLELYEVLDVPSKLPIKEGDPIVVSFDWTASVAFPSTTTMTIQWHGAYYTFIKGINTHTFDGVAKAGRTVLKGTFICPNDTTSNNKVKLGIRTNSTTVGSITIRNLAMYRGTVDQPFKLGPSDLATASAVSALTGRVDKTEEGLTTSSQNTTSLKNMITTGMSADSLVGDYAVSNNSFWYNHSTIPDSPAEARFTTVSDGKIGKTVFMVPDGTSHGFIYSKTGLPNTRQYKVTFWARRSSTAVGSSYVTVLRIPPSGVISTSGYTYESVTEQIPGTEVWTQVSKVIDLRSSADAYPTLHFGFCVNNSTDAGWSQVQGFKVEPVLSSKDLDTSVATSEALETLKSRVTKTEAGDITVNNEKLVDLKGKVDTTAGGTFSSAALDKMYTTTNFQSAVSGRLTEFNSSLVIGGANLISHGHSSFRVGSTSVTAAVRTIVDGAIRVTGGLPTAWHGWQNASTDWSQLVKLGPGSDFTVSLFVRAVSLTALPNVGFQIYVGSGYGYSAMTQVGTGVYTNGGLVQFAKTFTVTTTAINPIPHMHVTGTIGGGFEIVAWKIEKGNKATDWSMADKDIQIQLDSNASAINNIFTTAKWNEAVAGKLETYTSNLKVGSTNLLPNSDYSFGYDVWGGTLGTVAEINDATSRSKTWKITCTTAGTLGLQQNSISRTMSIVKGVKYVLSFKASGTNIAVVDYLHIMRPSGGNQRLGSVSGLTSTTSDFKIEFVAEWSSTTAWLLFGVQLSAGATITVSEIKIEEGSVVTSWAPSPKDVDYQLTQNAESTRLVQAWVDTNKSNVSDITAIKASTTAVRNDFDNILPLIRSITSANLVYDDPTFLEGSNSVSAYDNGGSNRVLVTRVPREVDNPTTSTHQVNITVSSGANPGYGGFIQLIQSRASAVFLVKYLLKLPVGYKLEQANNSLGLNAVDNFVGSTLGTGKYEFYYRLIRCGSTGSFSTTGHVYVTNTSTTMLTGTQTMTFPLASIETYDVTDYAAINPQLKKMLTTYTNSIDSLTDKDSSQGFKYEQLKSTFSMSSAVNQIPLAMNYDQKDKWIYVEYSRPTTIPVSKNITYEDINGLTPSRSMYVPQAIASGTVGGTADTNSMTASCLAIFRTMIYSSKAVSIAWGVVTGDDIWSLNVNGIEVSKTTVYTSSGTSVTLPLKAGWNHVDVLVNNNSGVGGFRSTVLLNTLVERMYAPDLADLNPNNAATILSGYYTKSDIDSSVAEKIQGASARYALQLVTIPDTRSVNSTPLEYYTNYPRRVVNEFKYGNSIGSPGGITSYGVLETTVPWNDASGGAVQQIFTTSDVSSNTWSRYSTSNTAWSPWKNSLLDIRTDLSLKANDADIRETFLAKADADNAVASALTTIAAKIGSDNILINGDFSASSISPWTANTSSNTVAIYIDANKKKWGRVASTNTTVSFKGISQIITPDRNGLKANQTYTISFTLKAMNTATTSVSLIIHRVNSAGNNQLTTSFSINTTNETFCKYTFTTVADITSLNIIPVASTGIAPDFLITDVQLQEGTYATAFQKSSVELSSAIQVQGEAISGENGINTKYTVKIDNGGLISGYGIIGSNNNGTPTSAFAVNASQFYIGAPASNKKPFIVLTEPGSIGGVTVPAGTYMDTAFIGDATINNAKIGQLDAAKITTGVLDAARIRVGSLTTYDPGYDPATNLQEAKNYVDVDSYASNYKVFNSVAGIHDRNNVQAGVLVIKTPLTMSAYMTQVNISGYNYYSNTETLFNISVGFYAYSGTSFLNTRANHSGVNLDYIKLALDSNNKVVILIKKTGNWSYPMVAVDQVKIGYATVSDSLKDNWSIAFETNVSAYTVNLSLGLDQSETVAGSTAKVQVVANQISDIAADNKLTAVEKKSIKLIWDDIQKEYSELSARATSVGLAYDTLTSSYNALNTYLTPLLANTNITSDIVRTTFENTFTSYRTAASELEKLITTWTINTAVDKVDIGGNNLIKNSNFANGLEFWTVSTATISVETDDRFGKVAKVISTSNTQGIRDSGYNDEATTLRVVAGQDYTLSGWVKASAAMSIFAAFDGNINANALNISATTSWQYFSLTGKATTNLITRFYGLGTFYVANIKLEKGNKATAWTAAPEDVNALIDSKAKTFLTTPTIPYNSGDIWKDGATTKVSLVSRVVGTFTASDWVLVGDVTSNNTAADTAKVNGISAATVASNAQAGKTLSDNVMSDLIITPVEKSALLTEWNRIKAEYTSIVAQATALSVDKTALTTAYTALDTTSPRIASEILASMTTNYVLTTTTRDAFKSQLNAYFVQATTVSKAITDKVNSLLGIAQSTADSKAKVFTSTPTVPYVIGDIWKEGATVKIAVVSRTTGSYTASDWNLVGDVTANNTAADTAKVNGINAATVASNAAKGLKVHDDVMSDLIITPVEKTFLNTEWNRIKAEYANLISQASGLGLTATTLTNAYNAVNTTAPSMTTILSSMVTSTTLTTTERNNFRTQLDTYYKQAVAMTKSIADKIAENAKAEVNNLIIGGSNLFSLLSLKSYAGGNLGNDVSYITVNGSTLNVVNQGTGSRIPGNLIPVDYTKDIIISWYPLGNYTNHQIYYATQDASGAVVVGQRSKSETMGSDGRIIITIPKTELSATVTHLRLGLGSTSNTTYSFKDVQVEQGSKVTAWSPSAKDVEDQIALKARTFITTPTTPYTSGDIFRNGSTIYVCTTARSSGAYTASDWTLVGDVTANNTAADSNKLGGTLASTVLDNASKGLAVYNDVMSDLKITPVEKTAINQEWGRIQKEYASLVAQATSLNVSTTTLTAAYNGLSTTAPAMSTILASMSTTTTLTAAQRDAYKVQYTTYYTQSADMVKAINEKIAANAQSAVDNIQIGGTNVLIRKDEQINTMVNTSGTAGAYAGNSLSSFPISVKAGEVLTFSKKFTSTPPTDNYFRYAFLTAAGGTLVTRSADSSDSFTVTAPATATVLIVSYPTSALVKIERSPYVTDWSPAPEDVDASIESKAKTFVSTPTVPYSLGDIWRDGSTIKVATTARATGTYTASDWTLVGDITANNTAADTAKVNGIAASTVTTNAAAGKAISDNILSDLVVTPVEKTALYNEWNRIKAEYSNLSDQASSYNVSTTDLTAAYNALNTTAVAVPTVLATMTANTTFTSAQRDAFRAKFNTYYVAATTLSKNVELAISNKAQTAIDNITIGGTNLYNYSQAYAGTGWVSGSTVIDTTQTYNSFVVRKSTAQWAGPYQSVSSVPIGFEVTLSFWAKRDAVGTFGVYATGAVAVGIVTGLAATTEWKRYAVTFKTTAATFNLRPENSLTTGVLYTCGLQLEIGNKATDWSSSQQDLMTYADSSISNIRLGGTNLFPASLYKKGYNLSSGNLSALTTTNHVTYDQFLATGSNTNLIYQVWNDAALTSANTNRVCFYNSSKTYISQVTIPVLAAGTPYQLLKIAIPASAAFVKLGAISGSNTYANNIRIKFEFGDNPTDWSVAPEDQQSTWETYVNNNTGNLLNNVTFSGTVDKWNTGTATNQTFQGVSVPVHTLTTSGDAQAHSDRFVVDPAKAYEVSVWLKSDQAVGSLYLGLVAQNSSGANIGVNAINRANPVEVSTANTNFYFHSVSGGGNPLDWVKWVGYIMPAGTPASSMKNLGSNIGSNARMLPQTTYMQVRWLNYYNGGTATTKWAANFKCVEVDPNAIIAGTFAQELADSKAKTFVSTPTIPYSLGDLWRDVNTVKVCTTARSSGAYTASDWTLVGDITSNNTSADTAKVNGISAATVASNAANGAAVYADVMSDLKITPVEKTAINQEWNRIQAEYSQYLAQATSLGLSTTAYTAAYTGLSTTAPAMSTILSSMTTTTTLTAAQRDAYKSQYTAYYSQTAAIVKAINEKIAANAKADLDNLEVGSRNLILNSKELDINYSSKTYSYLSHSLVDLNTLKGSYVTLSFEGKADSANHSLYVSLANNASSAIYLIPYANSVGFLTTEWKRYTFTTLVDNIGTNLNTIIYAVGYSGGVQSGIVNLRNIKLEKGNKATDWTPAPEDVDVAIASKAKTFVTTPTVPYSVGDIWRDGNTVKVCILARLTGAYTASDWTLVGDITSNNTSANTAKVGNATAAAVESSLSTVNDMSADNKLTPLEKQQAKTIWDSIVNSHSNLLAQATTTGVSSSAYTTAYNTLSTYLNTLFSSMTTTTTIVRTTFNTNFATLYMQKSALEKAINEKIASNAKADLDNLEIGSRNLLKDSALIHFKGSDNGNGGASVVVGDFVRLTPVNAGNVWGNDAATGGLVTASELLPGEQYTFSVMVKTAMTSIGLYCYSGGNHLKSNIPLKSGNVWERVSFTFTQSTARAKNFTFLAGFHQLQAGVVVEYRSFKLEKGNKATDWYPAPEDIDTAIQSKSKTFTTQPTTPYASGDIYRNGSSIYVCTTARTSGSYTAADWILVGDVTANNTAADTAKVNGVSAATVASNAANGALVYSDVMSDLKITPVEKTAINQEWNRIQKEYASLLAQAQSLSLTTTAYTAAYTGLSTTDPAMSTILASMSTTTTLTAAQRDAYKSQYTAYYTQAVAITKAINDKIAANAKAQADAKSKTFTAQPAPPYTAGDLWKDGSTIKVCTVTRASGSYTAADWTLVGDVTSANTAANSNQLGGTAASTVLNDISTANSTLNNWKTPNATTIDGAKITTGSITATQLSVQSLSALNAKIGTITTTGTQGSMTISDSLIEIRDALGNIRVRLGIW